MKVKACTMLPYHLLSGILWLWANVSAQDLSSATGLAAMSVLGQIRPAQVVVRSVKAAAPDLFLGLEDRLRGWGYPLETHKVRTEDGYLLTLHRIPRGRSATPDPTTPRPPVLLQHGLISCSEYWIIGGPNKAPALTLADQGYDVWLNNIRGNHYSRKHEKMKRRDKAFWNFSWHEMGVYDIPAAIDYVLNATGQKKLFYISHSMGNTVFYVAMTMRPEYNAKIRLQVAMAPAVFLNDSLSTTTQLLLANAEYIKRLVEAQPTYEIFTKSDSTMVFNYLLCNEKSYFNKLCAVFLSWIVGALNMNDTGNITMHLARSSSSTSGIVPWHFAQIIRSGEFRQLDLGTAGNLAAYGAPQPPEYPLERVTAPVAIYVADADFVVSPKGAERLARSLPNVVLHKVINDKFFNHLDFVFHPHVNELLMDHAMEIMGRY